MSSPSDGVVPASQRTEDMVNLFCDYLEANRYIALRRILMSRALSLAGGLPQALETAGDDDNQLVRMRRLHDMTAPLLDLIAVGCFWATPAQIPRLAEAVEHVANPSYTASGPYRMHLYPELLLAYGGGLAAIAARRYDTLAFLLIQVMVGTHDEQPLAQDLYAAAIIDADLAQSTLCPPAEQRNRTPASAYLFTALREPLWDLLPRDASYQDVFDRYEAF